LHLWYPVKSMSLDGVLAMTYRQIKWLILIIPTMVVGAWEYIRHEFLLSYISMEMGNWLTPLIVFMVTITLLLKLFMIYEQMQEELKKERAEKAVLKERERIARELHDGIAQTLFLCSVQLTQLRGKHPELELNEVDRHLRQVHENVRQSIFNLKSRPSGSLTWIEQLRHWIDQFELDTGIRVIPNIQVPEDELLPKEKAELFSCMQEALTNIRKHAHAKNVHLDLIPLPSGWRLVVEDDGIGFSGNPFQQANRFGLAIMRERAQLLGAELSLNRIGEKTRLVIEKGA